MGGAPTPATPRFAAAHSSRLELLALLATLRWLGRGADATGALHHSAILLPRPDYKCCDTYTKFLTEEVQDLQEEALNAGRRLPASEARSLAMETW
eukprot:SAG31_NODE_3129_length_4646_cov_2.581262_7_plen_96_part_00